MPLKRKGNAMRHDEISNQTKKELGNALKEAMRKKPFTRITVSELVDACGLNRKTFYYHFEDIYDLLKWIYEQEAINVVKKFDLMIDYDEALNFVMDYIEENDYLIKCAYDSLSRDALRQFLFDDFIGIMENFLADIEEREGRYLKDGYRAFIMNFFVESIASMIIGWARDHEKSSREEAAGYIYAVISDSLMGIFEFGDESLFKKTP